jgi:hypothetical protein
VSGGSRLQSGGDGVGATRQRVRQGEGGRCCRRQSWRWVRCKGGVGVVVVRMEAGTRAGARVSGGVNAPDVCGFWFQESLPLCMVINFPVLFFCLL